MSERLHRIIRDSQEVSDWLKSVEDDWDTVLDPTTDVEAPVTVST